MSKNEFICDCNVIHKEKVDKLTDKLNTHNYLDDISIFFKILGDETRIKIIYILDQEEMCVCDIANVLNMTKSSISHQLSNLKKNGIVKCRKVGKEVLYSLDDEHVKQVFEIGSEHIIHRLNKIITSGNKKEV